MQRFVAAAVLILLCAAPAVALTSAQKAAIDTAVMQQMQRDDVPGLSIGISSNGAAAYEHAYGYRTMTPRAKAQAGTVYEIGSITKTLTAVAVLQLVADGRVSLDAPISTYVHTYPAGAAITVHQLLAQTSGIPDYADTSDFSDWSRTQATPSQILSHVINLPLKFKPGTDWGYSNTNYLLLGMIIEAASGVSYDRYVAQHITAPLGMRATVYGRSTQSDRATGYVPAGNSVAPAPQTSTASAYSAAGFSSNVADLLVFDTALMQDKLLENRYTQQLFAPNVFADHSTDSYGMGLSLGGMYGQDVAYHTGQIDGFSAVNAMLPRTNTAIVLLSNGANLHATALLKSLVGILQSKAGAPPVLRFTPARNEDPAVRADIDGLLASLRSGEIERTRLDPALSSQLTPESLKAIAGELRAFGPIRSVQYAGVHDQGIEHIYAYRITSAAGAILQLSVGYKYSRLITSIQLQSGD